MLRGTMWGGQRKHFLTFIVRTMIDTSPMFSSLSIYPLLVSVFRIHVTRCRKYPGKSSQLSINEWKSGWMRGEKRMFVANFKTLSLCIHPSPSKLLLQINLCGHAHTFFLDFVNYLEIRKVQNNVGDITRRAMKL